MLQVTKALAPEQGHAPTPITSTGKRSLSRKTLSAITPNYNPNYIPPAPGHTPKSVHANRSPSSKRTRRISGSLTPELEHASSIPRPCLKLLSKDFDQEMSDGDVMPPLAACSSPARPQGRRQTGKELRSSLMAVDPCRLSMDPDGNIRLEGVQIVSECWQAKPFKPGSVKGLQDEICT